MDEDSTEIAASTPQLLNLIRDEREWKVGELEESASKNAISDAEDRKLELKLGLPDVQGEDRAARPREKMEQHEDSYIELSLGSFPTYSKPSTNTATAGAKRGFFATVDAKPQGCNQRHHDSEGCENELTLGGENMIAGERKKGCCPPSSVHDSAARRMHSSTNPQGRGAVLPVVGWPPVRSSFRRNLTNGSSSKQSPERQNDEAADKSKLDSRRSSLVKINMDGIPIGRKISLAAYDSFQKLSSAIEALFRGFLESQNGGQGAEENVFSELLDGTGEYTLVYEDSEGGRTLAGDLPWSVFASTAKRLRVMRSSELPHDLIKNAPGRVEDN